jgi:hypothetical protein
MLTQFDAFTLGSYEGNLVRVQPVYLKPSSLVG